MAEQTHKPTLLVTGSSGMIGSHVARRFAGAFNIVGLDFKPPPEDVPLTEHVDVDLTSTENVQRGLRHVRDAHGPNIASVIHLAAYYDFSGEPSDKYDQVTVRGTQRLLLALREFSVEQFIFSSTMLVHAPCEVGQHINEDAPLDPKWDYPRSKVRTEEVIRAEHGNVPVVLLRIAGVYDDFCHSIPIAQQIRRIYEKQMVGRVFPGDTSKGQAFVHLEDLVEALWLTVQRRAGLPPETILLIGEDQTLSYDELQREFSRLIHGREWNTRQIPKSVARTGAWLQDHLPAGEEPFIKPWMIDLADDHYALDITRARTLLGWEPAHSLRQGLPKMVAALQADPDRWYHAHKLGSPPKR